MLSERYSSLCKHSFARICAVPRTSIPLCSISVVGLRPMLCYPNSLMRKRLAIFVAQRTALSFHVKRKSLAMKSITARDELSLHSRFHPAYFCTKINLQKSLHSDDNGILSVLLFTAAPRWSSNIAD